MIFGLKRGEGVHDVLCELLAGCATLAAGDGELLFFKRADVERTLELVGSVLIADVGEEHYCCAKHRAGVGVDSSALVYHSRRRAVDGLEHSVLFTDVCASCRADAALELCGLIGNDITVKVGKKKNLEVAAALLVDELCRHNICVPLVSGDFGVEVCDLVAVLKEVTVGGFDNVGLGNERHSRSTVLSRVVVGKSCNSVGALLGGNGKVNGKVLGNVEA